MASGERAPQATRLLVIGNFDGVHLGHQAVVAEAVREATRRGLVPTVLTFDPHPAVILGRPARPMLTTVARKTDLLRRLDPRLEVVVLPFDLELASLTPDQFAQRILRGKLAAELVLVGQNFRFGKDRAGDLQVLETLGERLGFEARAEQLHGDEHGPYSSTRVRQALGAGDVALAARVLGRPHLISGSVERGDQRGRTLGFPTANLGQVELALPKDGVYFGRVRLAQGSSRSAVVNIGARPTVDRPGAVEVHLLDFSGDLYGTRLDVELLGRLRDVRKFSGLDELEAQIRRDVVEARDALGGRE